jgi:cytochrome c-type biogenesis protein CcmH/NrfG
MGSAVACLANIYQYRGETEKARDLLHEAIRLDPYCKLAYGNLVKVLIRGDEKDREELVRVVLEAHRLWPTDAKIARDAAGILREAHRAMEGLMVLDQTIDALPPGSPEREQLAAYARQYRAETGDPGRSMQGP